MAKGDKLKDYIRKERGRGFDDQIIREKLLETGYRQQDVESAFADLPHPAVVTARPTRNYKTIAIIIGACVLLLLIGSLVLGGTKNCGADEQCFIDRANVCQPASLSQDVQGAVFDYSAKVEITPDCTLTKTVTALDPSEPEEMKALFNGASMTCSSYVLSWYHTLVRNW